jgi:ATP adenylyltransferase
MAKKKSTPKKIKASPRKKAVSKTASSWKGAFLKLDQQIWPLERDVLFRPDRMKYVRKLIKPDGCVFCTAAKNTPSVETLCVYKFPYNSGHVLVLPQRHCDDMPKLGEEEFADLNNTLRLTVRALNEVYEPGGMNMGVNMGASGGAGIPEHLHYHLVPRWAGDLNFFPLIAQTKVLVESLEQTFDRLSSYFKSHE